MSAMIIDQRVKDIERALRAAIAHEVHVGGLRRAILLDPFDDLARLAYCDALEEVGRTPEANRIRTALAHPEAFEETTANGITAVERRGFVCSVSGSLADFMRTAKRVFKAWPITEVTLTNVEPQTYEGGTGSARFYLTRVPRGDGMSFTSHWIPEKFAAAPWRRVCDKLLHRSDRSFNDVPSALADLSEACVWYGRSLAGLPQLPPR